MQIICIRHWLALITWVAKHIIRPSLTVLGRVYIIEDHVFVSLVNFLYSHEIATIFCSNFWKNHKEKHRNSCENRGKTSHNFATKLNVVKNSYNFVTNNSKQISWLFLAMNISWLKRSYFSHETPNFCYGFW